MGKKREDRPGGSGKKPARVKRPQTPSSSDSSEDGSVQAPVTRSKQKKLNPLLDTDIISHSKRLRLGDDQDDVGDDVQDIASESGDEKSVTPAAPTAKKSAKVSRQAGSDPNEEPLAARATPSAQTSNRGARSSQRAAGLPSAVGTERTVVVAVVDDQTDADMDVPEDKLINYTDDGPNGQLIRRTAFRDRCPNFPGLQEALDSAHLPLLRTARWEEMVDDYKNGLSAEEVKEKGLEWCWGRMTGVETDEEMMLRSLFDDLHAAGELDLSPSKIDWTSDPDANEPSEEDLQELTTFAARYVRMWRRQGQRQGFQAFTLRGQNLLPVLISNLGDYYVGLFPVSKQKFNAPDYQFIMAWAPLLARLCKQGKLAVVVDREVVQPYMCKLQPRALSGPTPQNDPESDDEEPTDRMQNSGASQICMTDAEREALPVWHAADSDLRDLLISTSRGAEMKVRTAATPDIVQAKFIHNVVPQQCGQHPPHLPCQLGSFGSGVLAYRRRDFSSFCAAAREDCRSNGTPKRDVCLGLPTRVEEFIRSVNVTTTPRRVNEDGEAEPLRLWGEQLTRPYFNVPGVSARRDAHQSAALEAYEGVDEVSSSLNHDANLLSPFAYIGGGGFQLLRSIYMNGSNSWLSTPTARAGDVLMALSLQVGGQYSRFVARDLLQFNWRRHVEKFGADAANHPVELFGDATVMAEYKRAFSELWSKENGDAIERWILDGPVLKAMANIKLSTGSALKFEISPEDREELVVPKPNYITFATDMEALLANRVPQEESEDCLHVEREGKLMAVYPPRMIDINAVVGEGSLEAAVMVSLVTDLSAASMRCPEYANLGGFATMSGHLEAEVGHSRVPEWKTLADSGGTQCSQQSTTVSRFASDFAENLLVFGGEEAMAYAREWQCAYVGFPKMTLTEMLLWLNSDELILNGADGSLAKWVVVCPGCMDIYASAAESSFPPRFDSWDRDVATIGQTVLLPAISTLIATRGAQPVFLKSLPRTSGVCTRDFQERDYRWAKLNEKIHDFCELFQLPMIDASLAVHKDRVKRNAPSLDCLYGTGKMRELAMRRIVMTELGNAKELAKDYGLDGRLYRAVVLQPLMSRDAVTRDFAIYEWYNIKVSRTGYEASFTGVEAELNKSLQKGSKATEEAAKFLEGIEGFFTLRRTETAATTINLEEKILGFPSVSTARTTVQRLMQVEYSGSLRRMFSALSDHGAHSRAHNYQVGLNMRPKEMEKWKPKGKGRKRKRGETSGSEGEEDPLGYIKGLDAMGVKFLRPTEFEEGDVIDPPEPPTPQANAPTARKSFPPGTQSAAQLSGRVAKSTGPPSIPTAQLPRVPRATVGPSESLAREPHMVQVDSSVGEFLQLYGPRPSPLEVSTEDQSDSGPPNISLNQSPLPSVESTTSMTMEEAGQSSDVSEVGLVEEVVPSEGPEGDKVPSGVTEVEVDRATLPFEEETASAGMSAPNSMSPRPLPPNSCATEEGFPPAREELTSTSEADPAGMQIAHSHGGFPSSDDLAQANVASVRRPSIDPPGVPLLPYVVGTKLATIDEFERYALPPQRDDGGKDFVANLRKYSRDLANPVGSEEEVGAFRGNMLRFFVDKERRRVLDLRKGMWGSAVGMDERVDDNLIRSLVDAQLRQLDTAAVKEQRWLKEFLAVTKEVILQ